MPPPLPPRPHWKWYRIVIVTAMLNLVFGLQVLIHVIGADPTRVPPSKAASASIPSSGPPEAPVGGDPPTAPARRGFELLLQYRAAKKADATHARELAVQAREAFAPLQGNQSVTLCAPLFARYCDEELGQPLTPLTVMEGLEYQFIFHSDYDPTPLLTEAISPQRRTHLIAQLLTSSFTENRTASLARVLDSAALRPYTHLRGKTVVDLGCGLGALLPELTRRVGPNGVVYAQDIDPEVVGFLRFVSKKSFFDNKRVRIVQGTTTATHLPDEGADVMLLFNVHIGQLDETSLVACMEMFARAIKPGGHMIIVEMGLSTQRDTRDHAIDALEKIGMKKRVDIDQAVDYTLVYERPGELKTGL